METDVDYIGGKGWTRETSQAVDTLVDLQLLFDSSAAVIPVVPV